jgi:hypothetical protein
MMTDHEARLAEMSRTLRMYRAPVDDGMTAERIRAMSISEFARYRASVFGDEDTATTRPPVADEAKQHDEAGPRVDDMPPMPDFRQMSMDDYQAIRHNYIRRGSNRGLFGE